MLFGKIERQHQHRAEAARGSIHIGELLSDSTWRSDQPTVVDEIFRRHIRIRDALIVLEQRKQAEVSEQRQQILAISTRQHPAKREFFSFGISLGDIDLAHHAPGLALWSASSLRGATFD